MRVWLTAQVGDKKWMEWLFFSEEYPGGQYQQVDQQGEASHHPDEPPQHLHIQQVLQGADPIAFGLTLQSGLRYIATHGVAVKLAET